MVRLSSQIVENEKTLKRMVSKNEEDNLISMEFTVGAVLEGKVKSITNFGAFIALPEGKTGMVHISEVANAYVSDIRQHLTEGQDVKVMVIAVEPAGKINLSIKRLEPKPAPRNNGRPGGFSGQNRPTQDRSEQRPRAAKPQQTQATVGKSGDQSFEEKLKQFMSESDSKISSIRQYSDHRTKSRKR